MSDTTRFVVGEYYHIFNRGVDKRVTFNGKYDYLRFLTSVREFNSVEPIGSLYEKQFLRASLGRPTSKLVEIIAYSLLPNHYHIILRQVAENGVSEFMKRLGGGYTKYFNEKNGRSGSLFQGRFKYVHVESDDYLLQLACYIIGNPEIHGIAEAKSYPWSCYNAYIGHDDAKQKNPSEIFCNPAPILSQFDSIDEFVKTLNDVVKDSAERKREIRKNLLEV